MKRISRGFFNGLKQVSTRLCKCWRIETEDGLILGFTEHDQKIVISEFIGGETVEITYEPTNAFSSTAFAQSSDLSVDNISVVALLSDAIKEHDLHAGKFDNADVKIFYVQWDNLAKGTMALLGARFGEITFMDGKFETELRSRGQALQQNIGEVYGLECNALFGDERCTVDAEAYTFEGTVSAPYELVGFFDMTGRNEPDDYFQYGTVKFTSGQNEGLEIEVRGYKQSSHIVHLLEPMPYPIETGDTYQITAGCDKVCDTCRLKFDNLVNFRGFPHMPTEQEATETPDAKE
jgi:uncharacterized phage protein (TIGR02218 family)